MITRDQFEAHVRAEAKKAHPLASAVGSMLSSRAIHRLEEFDDKAELRREAYIAARMEHEWPLVVAMQFIGIDAREVFDHGSSLLTVKAGSGRIISHSDAALSPYTTKPIEP